MVAIYAFTRWIRLCTFRYASWYPFYQQLEYVCLCARLPARGRLVQEGNTLSINIAQHIVGRRGGIVLFWNFGLHVFLNRLLFICMFLVLGCFCVACAPLFFPMCLLVFASVCSFACAPLLLFLLVPPCFACVCFCFCFRLLDFAFAYACLFLLLLVSFCFGSGLGDRKMRGQETK